MRTMYYGSKLSPNISETEEGYLICHNVPIGRTGTQEYLAQEIGLDDMYGQMVKVCRSPDEVFSPATMASFEGKPITDLHPSKNLDVNTAGFASKGHAQNVRQGLGSEADLLLADLFIIDPKLIDDIKNGIKREVSCGYDCIWNPIEDGYEQTQIRGNHVAVVPKGRAGERVAIKDESPKNKQNEGRKKPMSKITKGVLAALGLKQYVQDAEPEQIAEAMKAMGKDDGEGEAAPIQKQEDDALAKILTAINALGERVTALESSDKQVHSEIDPEKALDAFANEVEKGESGTIEEETKDANGLPDADVASNEDLPKHPLAGADSAAFIRKMKPIICAIPDAKERKAASDAFIAMFKTSGSGSGTNGYATIQKTTQDAKVKAAQDSKAQQQETMESRANTMADNYNKMYKGGK